MKRLSLIAGIAALMFLVPGIASAHGRHGGGFHGGGATFHDGGYHAAAVGGGRNYVAARHGAYLAPHGGYSVAPWHGGWRAHPYSAVGIGARPSPRHVWVRQQRYWAPPY